MGIFGLFGTKRNSLLQQLKREADTAWNDASGFRNGLPLSELEKVLSFYAWLLWLSEGAQLKQAGDSSHFQHPNTTAREMAILTIANLGKSKAALSAIRRKRPNFNPVSECEWGWFKTEHREWKECTTRSIVLGCRLLAYSLSGAAGWMAPVNSTSFGELIGRIPMNASGAIVCLVRGRVRNERRFGTSWYTFRKSVRDPVITIRFSDCSRSNLVAADLT
jgi:hypothetical protein